MLSTILLSKTISTMSPLSFVVLQGGLGNQLFQIALGKHIINQDKSNKVVYLDCTKNFKQVHNSHSSNIFSLRLFRLPKWQHLIIRLIASRVASFFPRLVHYVDDKNINDGPMNKGNTVFALYNGYWQKLPIAHAILPDLSKRMLSLYPNSCLCNLYRQSSEFIRENLILAVHIRRGDFFRDSNSIHAVCSLDWYVRSIDFYLSKNNNANVIIFTDDIAWAKSNQQFSKFILFDEPVQDEEVLAYMSSADDFIISNSTFSYWAALVKTFRDSSASVIAPFNWFVNVPSDSLGLLPQNWTLLK